MREDITHTVLKGENLYSISQKYQISVSQLMELNELKNTIILPGQILFISKNSSHDMKDENSYQEFLQKNLGIGTLKIQTLIGNTYFPIQNAKIEVYKIFNHEKKVFYTGYTEESGLIDSISLPTPIRRTDYLNGASIYQIEATHPDYQTVTIQNVSIYDGVKSIQKIEMIPNDYPARKELFYGK